MSGPISRASRSRFLTPQEKVELLRIVTAGDVTEMQEFGNYNFFRVGITPDGRWKFLSVGD